MVIISKEKLKEDETYNRMVCEHEYQVHDTSGRNLAGFLKWEGT